MEKTRIPSRYDIPVGRENAITRLELSRLWGVDDRTARDIVARMRITETEDQRAILSSSHNPPGYWRSDNTSELEQFERETQARARNTLAVLADVRRVLRNA